MSEPSASVFKAIGDPTRRSILDLLAGRERSVNELVERFAMTQPAMSQHLKVLRAAGLVSPRRQGRHRFYRIEPAPLREVYDWVRHYERFWDQKLAALGRFLDGDRDADNRQADDRQANDRQANDRQADNRQADDRQADETNH